MRFPRQGCISKIIWLAVWKIRLACRAWSMVASAEEFAVVTKPGELAYLFTHLSKSMRELQDAGNRVCKLMGWATRKGAAIHSCHDWLCPAERPPWGSSMLAWLGEDVTQISAHNICKFTSESEGLSWWSFHITWFLLCFKLHGSTWAGKGAPTFGIHHALSPLLRWQLLSPISLRVFSFLPLHATWNIRNESIRGNEKTKQGQFWKL